MHRYLFLLSATLFTLSCTANQMARVYGGTLVVDLPCDQKLINVTWKETSLWYDTRPMRADEEPETHTFQEKSPRGMQEGTVILKECSTRPKVQIQAQGAPATILR